MGIGSFLIIDVRDIQNYVALAIAVPLLWWGISTIIKSMSAG